jgi:DNA-binding Xre family transcriptional regulator
MKQSTISRLLNGEKVCIRIADVGAIAAAVGMEPNDLVRALAENPAINP